MRSRPPRRLAVGSVLLLVPTLLLASFWLAGSMPAAGREAGAAAGPPGVAAVPGAAGHDGAGGDGAGADGVTGHGAGPDGAAPVPVMPGPGPAAAAPGGTTTGAPPPASRPGAVGRPVVVAAPVRPAPAAAAAAGVPAPPLGYHGPAGQVITVVGRSAGATTATVTAWQRSGDGWTPAAGPMTGYVGAAGIGAASESTTRTPAGVWSLTEAFGIAASNGTRLPYRQVGTSDWWVSDVHSPLYNTYRHCDPGTCPFDESAGEDLGAAGAVYGHAVVIDYNRHPVTPGAGSAYFLHVTNGAPTAGCVAVPAAGLDLLMRWLDPAQQPVVDIGVGTGTG